LLCETPDAGVREVQFTFAREAFRLRYRGCALLCLVGIVAGLVGCSSSSKPVAAKHALDDDAITVGSFDFAESELLSEINSQALERRGYHVKRAFRLGPRELVAPALFRGLVELVPEYAGTALQFASLNKRESSSDVTTTRAQLERTLAPRHVTALEPAPAQDANAFVVTRRTAVRNRLRTLSDLARVDASLALGGPPECPTREHCLAGLEHVYGLRFKEFVRLDAGGPITRQALEAGYVDVALLFTTDPAIAREHLVELTDDRNLQPAENVIPLVRTELVDRFGSDLVDVVDAVSAQLTTSALTELNARVEAGGHVAAVASAWLNTKDIR
jgi:osmoprotectant transport system substrate-binding protein